jgi:anti-anti-sigma factor
MTSPLTRNDRPSRGDLQMAPTFACDVSIVDGHAVIRLCGELDLACIDQLHTMGEHALADPALRRITVDCSGITFFGSTALGVFISWRNRSADRDCVFELEAVPPAMMRVLEITKLATTFRIRP